MTPETPPTPRSPFKNPYLYSSVALIAAALYAGYILYSRHAAARLYEQQQMERRSKLQREEDRQAVEQLGGSDFAIRGLYLSPQTIHAGETAQLCYDVSNAKTVTLDPPVAEVWPSHSRCITLTPKKSTTYTLTIHDAAEKTVSESVELHVR